MITTAMIQVDSPEQHKKLMAGGFLGCAGRAEADTNVVAFLASERASFITCETAQVNGGPHVSRAEGQGVAQSA